MPKPVPDHDKPLTAWRKEPRQARSEATVEAILEATAQVILTAGTGRLTTTRVAARAGVSVGTMYQYFPNKQALMRALLQRHMELIATVIEAACDTHRGQPIETIAEALVGAFLHMVRSRPDESRAAYIVAVEPESAPLLVAVSRRVAAAVAALLASAADAAVADLADVSAAVTGALAGGARSLIERGLEPAAVDAQFRQLTLMMKGYLRLAARAG